ncbi:hypothetical protein L596_012483 [Steinernema carpocapsae]|uniref:Uncharacterized protein n=1 Tax=Steinernema carpocapsae TaxID=34508 RepID=A0A4U5NXJ1_STECR|nr:hypothetical protein L596_012483 [Steinernema carpocapsae]
MAEKSKNRLNAYQVAVRKQQTSGPKQPQKTTNPFKNFANIYTFVFFAYVVFKSACVIAVNLSRRCFKIFTNFDFIRF